MVSIIVPVYRAETWLEECIGSILGQTYGNWELLLIDDGSPDGCGCICDAWARGDTRIRVLHQQNRGPAAARNAGLDLARGDYITFCDADDAWEPEHLQGLREAAEAAGAQIVSCNYKVVDEAGRFLRQSRHIGGVISLNTQEDRVRYLLQRVLSWETGWEVWSRLFSTGMLREHGIRFCETCGDYGEDLAFVLSACLYANRVCGLEAATCRYRLHPASLTARRKTARNLDSLNEVSRDVWRHYGDVIREPALKNLFPLLHQGILRGVYEALPAVEFLTALEGLRSKAWFFRQTRELLRLKPSLLRYFGKEEAGTILTRARFCMHCSVFRFRLEKCLLSGDLYRNICGILLSVAQYRSRGKIRRQGHQPDI